MSTALLHSHKLFVILFLLHYLLKAFMLLANKHELLARYTKATRIPEIVISTGFLVTGVWMLINLPNGAIGSFMIIKLVCVFASIPLAVIGFKKGNKALAALAVLLIIMAYGLAEMSKKQKAGGAIDTTTVSSNPIEEGKLVYQAKCEMCHGADGKLGLAGAKDLGATQLNSDEQKQLIRSGKNSMPAFGAEVLTNEQVDAVVQYVATLK
jgi:mono/diheme cytochrome c family protein